MKRALTQAFTKDHENLVCEFHVTLKNNYLHMKMMRYFLIIPQLTIFSKQSCLQENNLK